MPESHATCLPHGLWPCHTPYTLQAAATPRRPQVIAVEFPVQLSSAHSLSQPLGCVNQPTCAQDAEPLTTQHSCMHELQLNTRVMFPQATD
jgi:hypothetical protein